MGTVNSKTIEKCENERIPTGSVPTTPILTPRIKTLREMDPRSPSTNIIRTPIEVILSKKLSKLPNYVDEVTTTQVGTPKFIRLNEDPRSPNLEYPRTPLVIPNKKSDSTEQTETPKTIPNAERRKSYVLLETNLDYIETDLDAVRQKISPLNQIKNMDNIDNIQEIDELSAEVEAVDINKKEEEPTNVKCQTQDDKKFDEEVNSQEEENLQTITENKVETKEIETNKQETKEVPTKIETKESKKENQKDLTVVLENVRDFDKKLTNLIYEDQGMDSIKKSKSSRPLRNRTPLGMRNDNVDSKKRIAKLKVADKPRKLNKEFSKIPVSKQKKVRSNVQCENTPPRSKLPKGAKLRRPDWDGDKTMII